MASIVFVLWYHRESDRLELFIGISLFLSDGEYLCSELVATIFITGEKVKAGAGWRQQYGLSCLGHLVSSGDSVTHRGDLLVARYDTVEATMELGGVGCQVDQSNHLFFD